MSINRLMMLQQASPPAGEPEGHDWLLTMLRELMTAVAQEEGDTLKKAGMIARLAALYLRASGAAELKRRHKELARRCAGLEEQIAALQRSVPTPPPPAGDREARPQPTRSDVERLAANALPRVSVRTPLAPEPDAPPMMVIGSPAGRNRGSPAR